MEIQPCLFFDGCCEEAVEFYKKAIGAEVLMMLRFKDSPEPHGPPETADKVMHGRVRIGATTILVSDGRSTGQTGPRQPRSPPCIRSVADPGLDEQGTARLLPGS